MKTIMFTGGGTGGHIYPGLAIADALREHFADINIVWIGSLSKRDKRMVLSHTDSEGKPSCNRFIGIPSGKLRRYFSLKNFIDVFKIAFGFMASVCILLKVKPVLLFSKGGFVSVPPCAAARLLRIKVYTHECDMSPGLATRLNARFAKKVLLSYAESKRFFSETMQKKLIVAGNPVREIFLRADSKIGYDFLKLNSPLQKPLLLILGGSSGAHQINTLVFEHIDTFTTRFTVVHQTGEGADYIQACEIQQSLSDNKDKIYLPFDFIYAQMPHVLASADIIFSRAGANSLWESAVLQKPMLLLPLEGSGTRGDQVENADFFAKQGCAIVLRSSEKSPEKFLQSLNEALEIMSNESRRKEYANASKNSIRNDSAKNIASLLYNEL
ncbi:MAG: UDP-N-acetylglucosamine--N-acetylmuramyl-(pentapeptide) pyrophosphoryl-undecaprenol N-acetylglucosamine transferase [Spirochaetales bacterium]